MSNVQVGQVWEDNDKRRLGRLIEVVGVNNSLVNCELVANGKREKTKIRLDRFKPKYYTLKTKATATTVTLTIAPSTTATQVADVPATVSTTPATDLSVACSKVLGGNWGGFGHYALFDNNKVHIIVRLVRADCYDVKIRLSGHLVYSNVSRADLDTTLGQVRAHLKSLRDNIEDVVG